MVCVHDHGFHTHLLSRFFPTPTTQTKSLLVLRISNPLPPYQGGVFYLLAISGGVSGALWATNGSASGAAFGHLWRRFWGASGRPMKALLGRFLATSDGASGAPLGDQWERLSGAFWRPLAALLGRLLATSGGGSGAPLGSRLWRASERPLVALLRRL